MQEEDRQTSLGAGLEPADSTATGLNRLRHNTVSGAFLGPLEPCEEPIDEIVDRRFRYIRLGNNAEKGANRHRVAIADDVAA